MAKNSQMTPEKAAALLVDYATRGQYTTQGKNTNQLINYINNVIREERKGKE